MQFLNTLKAVFIRQDPTYDKYCLKSQSIPNTLKLFYLFMYIAPGILAYLIINVKPVYRFLISISGLEGKIVQLIAFFFVTYLWHMMLPVFLLRRLDKLSWKEVWAYLGLNKFDWNGVVLILPVFLITLTLLSNPYLVYIGRPFSMWIDKVPTFAIPAYSIFNSYKAMFSFSPVIIILMLAGNLVGEELYFRGYLLKKSAFLGRYNIWINGLLFAGYHLWQIPQTWPLFGLTVVFGILMTWRKNLYPLIFLHALLNFVWPPLYYLIFKTYPYF